MTGDSSLDLSALRKRMASMKKHDQGSGYADVSKRQVHRGNPLRDLDSRVLESTVDARADVVLNDNSMEVPTGPILSPRLSNNDVESVQSSRATDEMYGHGNTLNASRAPFAPVFGTDGVRVSSLAGNYDSVSSFTNPMSTAPDVRNIAQLGLGGVSMPYGDSFWSTSSSTLVQGIPTLPQSTGPMNVPQRFSGSLPIDAPVIQSASISYAGMTSKLDTSKGDTNFKFTQVDNVFEGVDISIPRRVIENVGNRFENTLYGYFIGKREAFPVVEYFVKNN